MRKLLWPALVFCMLSLQSCFEVIEQIILKNDGSGSLQLVLNMSKSRTKLNSIMKMKTVNGHKVPDKEEIERQVAETEKQIKATPGISNVKTSIDFDNFILTFNCDFKDVNNINEGIKKLAEKQKNPKPVEKSFEYNMAAKTFSRFNKFLVKEEYDKMSAADKEIFATANYTSIFRFETPVAGTTNKESKISADKKAVMLKLNALDIISNKHSIENKIQLK